MLRAGSLNKIIEIQRKAYNQGSKYGDNTLDGTYETYITTRASISPLSGKETFAQGIDEEITHKIIIRGKYKVDSSMIILYQTRIFEIVSALNWNEEDKVITIIAKETL